MAFFDTLLEFGEEIGEEIFESDIGSSPAIKKIINKLKKINFDITKGKFLPDPSDEEDREQFAIFDELKQDILGLVFGGGAGAEAEAVVEEAEIFTEEELAEIENLDLSNVVISAEDEEIFSNLFEELEEVGEELQEVVEDVDNFGKNIRNIVKFKEVFKVLSGIFGNKDKEPKPRDEPDDPFNPPHPSRKPVPQKQSEDVYRTLIMDKELLALTDIEEKQQDILTRMNTRIDLPINRDDFIKDLNAFFSKEAKEEYLEENFDSLSKLQTFEIQQISTVMG